MVLQALLWALVAASGTAEVDATPRPAAHDAGARHAGLIGRLVRRGDPAAIEYVVRSARRGMPPRSIEAFLEAAREAPNNAYVPLLRELSRYRKVRYRALALVALGSVSQDHGAEAALRAMDDPALNIRLLGLSLAEQYTAPNVEEAVILLLERDARVAKIVADARRSG